MAVNPERGEGRRTRSQGANLDKKGKSAVEATSQRIYLDIPEESEEEFDIRDYIAEEEQRPTSGGKVGKWKQCSTAMGDRGDIAEEEQRPISGGKVGKWKKCSNEMGDRGDTDESSEEDEEEAGGRRGRSRGLRGRGNQRGSGRPKACGGRGSRAQRSEYEEGSASEIRGRKRGKKDMRKKLQEVEEAYLHETNPSIRRIIDHLEEDAMQEISDPELEDWERFLPDPGHTRGRMSLYKQSLHVYWGMKRLLAKAMEQVAMEMVELAQGIPTLKRELKNIQVTLLMQDRKMDKLLQMFKASGVEVKVESEAKPDTMNQ